MSVFLKCGNRGMCDRTPLRLFYSYLIGLLPSRQNGCRETAIWRNDSTLNIKRFRGRFRSGGQFIDKFLYYINCVGLNQNCSFKPFRPVGQLYNHLCPSWIRGGVEDEAETTRNQHAGA
jgi:hypothetical protein